MLNQDQSGGDNSLNIQANRDVVINSGLSASEVITLAELVFKQNFPNLLDAARDEARNNVEKFFNELSRQAASYLTDQERGRFATADMKYALLKASEQMARKPNRQKAIILSQLLVKKAKTDNDLVDSILTESIEVAAKLSKQQIELCCFVSLLNAIVFKDGETDRLKQFPKDLIKEFRSLATKNEEVGMLVCWGCAAYQPAIGTFESVLLERHKALIPLQYNGLARFGINSSLQGDVREWFGFSDDEKAFLDAFNSSDAHAVYISPLGRAIALAYMDGKDMLKSDWEHEIGG